MTERTEETDDVGPAAGERAPASTGAGAEADRVREVVGRRGYDEAEDEAATEDEQH